MKILPKLTMYASLWFTLVGATNDYVKAQLPELYEIVSKELGAFDRIDFFIGWSPLEVSQFKMAELRAKKALAKADTKTFSQGTAFSLFGNFIYSTLGELYLSAYIRGAFQDDEDVLVMDEFQLNNLTDPKVSRPDGIVYHIKNHKLFILNVLESKVGLQSFDKKQASKYFYKWQEFGLKVLNDKMQGIHFYPEQIFIVSGFRWFPDDFLKKNSDAEVHSDLIQGYKTAVPISAMDLERFVDISVTVGTQVREQGVGQYIRMPLTTESLFKVSNLYVQKVFDLTITPDAPSPRVQRDSARSTAADLNHLDFAAMIRQWFLSQTEPVWHWPKPNFHFDGIDGRMLRSAINQRRSQSHVFIYHTDLVLKKMIIQHDALPPFHNLHKNIRESSDINESILDAIRAIIEERHQFRPEFGIDKFKTIEIVNSLAEVFIKRKLIHSLDHFYAILYPCQNIF